MKSCGIIWWVVYQLVPWPLYLGDLNGMTRHTVSGKICVCMSVLFVALSEGKLTGSYVYVVAY